MHVCVRYSWRLLRSLSFFDMSAFKRGKHVDNPSSSSKRRRGAAISCVSFSDDDFNGAVEELPSGPNNYEELSQWPLTLLSCACDASQPAVERLQEFVRHGHNNSDYSGYDCPRQMLSQVWKAMTYCDFFQLESLPSLTFNRACDCAPLPLQALRYWSEIVDKGTSCLNVDIEGVLKKDSVKHLDKLESDAHTMAENLSSKAEQMEVLTQCFSSMQSWLVENRGTAFTEDLRSPCLTHGVACPLAEARAEGDKSLALNWAGTTCIGWSSVGKRETFSHISERTHAVWLTTRICQAEQRKEDGFFQDTVCFNHVFELKM